MAKQKSPQKKIHKKSWIGTLRSSQPCEDKDEALDAVYWSRQVLALVMGLVWGNLGITGFVGIVSFILLNCAAAYALAKRTGYDFEPDENFLIIKEGSMSTFAAFLVTWIISYTASHYTVI